MSKEDPHVHRVSAAVDNDHIGLRMSGAGDSPDDTPFTMTVCDQSTINHESTAKDAVWVSQSCGINELRL